MMQQVVLFQVPECEFGLVSKLCSLCEEVKLVANEFNPVVSALALTFLFHPIDHVIDLLELLMHLMPIQ